MKQIIALTTIFAALSAQSMTCTQIIPPNVRLAYQYEIRINENMSIAEVIKIDGNGSTLVDRLKCYDPQSSERPGNGGINPTYAYLTCRTPRVFDAGFSLNVSYQPVINKYPASLGKVTIAGTKTVANFDCR